MINNNVKINLDNVDRFIKINLGKFEYQYARALNRILEEGVRCHNRTGIDTFAVNHQTFVFENINNYFPIIRGKKVFPLMPLKEMLWMLHGRTDVQWLQDRGVNYWNEWADENGTIGKSYGYQYRNFNGIDQFQQLLERMKKDPMGRRHIISLWNINDLNEMNLPPCIHEFNFSCVPVEKTAYPLEYDSYNVDLHVHCRSNDSFLGAPYDFMQVAWLLNIVCLYLNSELQKWQYQPRNIYYIADNWHLYENHIEQAKQYLSNVQENKEYCISSNFTRLHGLRFIDFKNIDDFLNIFEELTIKKKEFKLLRTKDGGFEYGKIAAKVAV